MKKLQTWICAALLLCMTLSIFSGCAKKEETAAPSETKAESTTTETPETEAPETEAPEEEKASDVTLRFLDIAPSPDRQTFYENAFADFEAQTGIKVEYESVPWDDAANKVTILGAADELPDLMICGDWLGQMHESGWLLPMDDYIAEHGDEYVSMCDMIWNAQRQIYGCTYLIPSGINVKGIFYRTDWVEETGYEIPTGNDWTYDEYFNLIQALTDTEQKRYGNSFRGARGGIDPCVNYMASFFDGSYWTEDGKSIFNTEEGVEAFKKWYSIYMDGYAAKDSVNWGFVEMVDNFTGSLTGTILNDPEVAAFCEASMGDGTWSVLPMPVSEDGLRINDCGFSYSYAVPSDTKHPEEAFALLDYLCDPEVSAAFCKMGGYLPVKISAMEDPLYSENGPFGAFIMQANDPNLVAPSGYGGFNTTDLQQGGFVEWTQKYMLGQCTAEEACKAIGDELEARLNAWLAEDPNNQIPKPITVSE